MNKQILSIAAAALLASFGAQANVIDLFTTDQSLLDNQTNNSVMASQVSTVGGDIIGGYRDLQAYTVSGAVSGFTGTSIGVTGGNLLFSTDTSVDGQGAIIWDGSTAAAATVAGFAVPNYTGLGGKDLTAGGTLSAVSLTTVFADQTWWFTLYMYTDSTHWTSVQLKSLPNALPKTDIVPFSAFTTLALCGTNGSAPDVGDIVCGSGGTADATNIGALMAVINTGSPLTTSIDLQLTAATTVPEPETIGLLGIGLLGMGLAGKARRRNKV